MIFDVDFNNIASARQELQMLIFNKQTTKATEEITQHLKNLHFFKSIRNDNNMEIWVYQDGIYQPNGKSYILEYTRELLGLMFTTYLGNQVVTKIYVDTFIEQDEFFNQQNNFPNLLPVKNGILNLNSKTLYPFTPDKYFFSKINAYYDENSSCDNIKKFIKSIVANEKDVKTLQEIIGYCLLREYRFEKGFMFYGEKGRNGKSKLLTLIKEFIGIENCSSVSLQDIEKEQFCLINLHNKLVNISADLSEYAIDNTGMYKALTGRDLINANRKGQSHIKFVNYAKMIFACNDLPIVRNFSSAFSLRWVMVDFPYRFLPQHELDYLDDKTNTFLQDTEILNNLTTATEFSGLLNWALEGLDRVKEFNKFSNETNSNAVRKYWLRKSNSVSAFIDDYCEFDYNSQITKRDFRLHYNNYCKNNKLKQMSEQAILITLTNEMSVTTSYIRIGENERVHIWQGIKFKDLMLDKTQLVYSAIEKNPIHISELESLFNNNLSELLQTLKILEQEGKISELPKGMWRVVK
jgi:putative DNA primase/helicase